MGSPNEGRMAFGPIRACRYDDRGEARVGPDKDRIGSNGHDQSHLLAAPSIRDDIVPS